MCFLQIHDLATEVREFVPEKADEILSSDDQDKIKGYINRQVCAFAGPAHATAIAEALHAATTCAAGCAPENRSLGAAACWLARDG